MAMRRATGTIVAVALLAFPALASARDIAAGPPHRSILHEVTGAGLSHRVVVSRRSWWRLENGGVVLYIVGADDLATDLEGTRVLCLRSRWTITPAGAAGTVAILQETVSDPRPPFGLTGLVTEEPLPDVSARFASCLLGS